MTTLIDCARQNHAPDYLPDRLHTLPDRQFDTVEEVWEALPAA